MNLPAMWITLAGVLALLVGLWLSRAGRAMRLHCGLGSGKTVSLDNVTLISHRLGLVGRPDRLVKSDGMIVCEEWKSGREPRPWHVLQVGVYFLLIEERYRSRPTHGFIVTGDSARHRVDNSDELRSAGARYCRTNSGSEAAGSPLNPGRTQAVAVPGVWYERALRTESGLTSLAPSSSERCCVQKPKGAWRLPWRLSPSLRRVTDIRCRSRE